ncbi:MAG: porin family protein [Mariniphaga sp.]
MKRSFFTIALLTMVLSTFAQLPITFDIGLKAGINSSKITTDNPGAIGSYTFNDFVSDAKSGYNVGAFARIGAKKIYFQPELLYVMKKGQTNITYTASSNNLTTSQTFNVKSIQIPLLVGFKLINLKIASVRAFTGPAMSFSVGDSKATFAAITAFNQETLKKNTWDWQLGGGVDLGPLVLDVRYEWGLSKITGESLSPTNMGFKSKGNFLTFSLGFKFI